MAPRIFARSGAQRLVSTSMSAVQRRREVRDARAFERGAIQLSEQMAGLSGARRALAAPSLDPRFDPLFDLPPVPGEDTAPARAPQPQGVLQGWWRRTLEMFQGRTATRELMHAREVSKRVEALEPYYRNQTNLELRGETERFKEQLARGTEHPRRRLEEAQAALERGGFDQRPELRAAVEAARLQLYRAEQKILDALLPQAFATVREAAFRATGLRPFDQQVQAAVLMHKGLIAEMYTGEGKTLAAVMAVYLGALPGHGFHVATANDYLARRDAEEMGAIYGFLGLSVGVLQAEGRQLALEPPKDEPTELEPVSRREAYQKDITYGTISELGFDYLRDQGVHQLGDRVQRPPAGLLVDEIDAVLIDEARLPLIIAGPGAEPDRALLERVRDVVEQLDWQSEVEWRQDEHWASLTDRGQDHVERALGVGSLYVGEHQDLLRMVLDALQARFLLRRDQDYTVAGDQVLSIGKGGHAHGGRRFAYGLHQALEAKERVPIRADTLTRASITLHDYYQLYPKRTGMTGTALSARELFAVAYDLDVARVQTRHELIRVDHPDRIFRTTAEKTAAFLHDVAEVHATGRPVLIGVTFTDTAEKLGALLAERGIPVQVLTAKDDAREAEIIANAGRLGAVTVVTTRGGRGVDIKLGGNPRVLAELALKDEALPKSFPARVKRKMEARARAALACAKEQARVLELGGLHVMGYEHLDSRRRDDQLRGRCGRQGDPGATVFYSALEDTLYDGLIEAERVRQGLDPYSREAAMRFTEVALDRAEAHAKEGLCDAIGYDQVLGLQRRHFYGLREDLLAVRDSRPPVRKGVEQAIEDSFDDARAAMLAMEPEDVLSPAQAKELYQALRDVLPLPELGPPPDWSERPLAQLEREMKDLAALLLERRDRAVTPELNRLLERTATLEAFDDAWSMHLERMAALRDGIGWRALGMQDPKREYGHESLAEFEALLHDLRGRAAAKILKLMPRLEPGPVER